MSLISFGNLQNKNNLNNKIIAIVGVVFVACLVTLGVVFLKKSKLDKNAINKQEKNQEIETNLVFISDSAIYTGQKLADAPLRQVSWPKDEIPEDAIKQKQFFVGKFAVTDIPPNVPLLKSHVSEKIFQSKLKVSDGNRAVTIQVDSTSGLEGLAEPGTRVDVVLTHSTDDDGLKSQIIVKNARILSVGGNTRRFNEQQTLDPRASLQSAGSNVKTITLEVSPEGALTITTAVQMGKISLLARPIGGVERNGDMDNFIVTEHSIDPKPEPSVASTTNNPKECIKGNVKSGEKEYQVNCDGTLVEKEELEE